MAVTCVVFHESLLLNSDLSRNRIKVIKFNYFLRARNIEELNLARNEIHQIEESAFDDLTNLRVL